MCEVRRAGSIPRGATSWWWPFSCRRRPTPTRIPGSTSQIYPSAPRCRMQGGSGCCRAERLIVDRGRVHKKPPFPFLPLAKEAELVCLRRHGDRARGVLGVLLLWCLDLAHVGVEASAEHRLEHPWLLAVVVRLPGGAGKREHQIGAVSLRTAPPRPSRSRAPGARRRTACGCPGPLASRVRSRSAPCSTPGQRGSHRFGAPGRPRR